ncbi:hypothetical protein EDB86DRAFT_3244640 [Lactarius hatsudake]|nr:hypothetical protein EDB86DRAFT_3244640 [Lactarius hatsudake]
MTQATTNSDNGGHYGDGSRPHAALTRGLSDLNPTRSQPRRPLIRSFALRRSVRDRFRPPATNRPVPSPDAAALARGSRPSTQTRPHRRGPIHDTSRPAEACAIPHDASHPPKSCAIDCFLAFRDGLGLSARVIHSRHRDSEKKKRACSVNAFSRETWAKQKTMFKLIENENATCSANFVSRETEK